MPILSNVLYTYTCNSKGVEVRFSSEDSFRSDLVDLLTLYKAVDKAGVGRVYVLSPQQMQRSSGILTEAAESPTRLEELHREWSMSWSERYGVSGHGKRNQVIYSFRAYIIYRRRELRYRYVPYPSYPCHFTYTD